LVEPTNRAVPLAHAHLPCVFASLWALSLILLYLFVSTHTPLNVLAGAAHDDGLFITLGRYLSEGRWLGPFNQFTLMKGPGYPAFLAVNSWLGTPISVSHALFHCLAVTIFTLVAHRFIRSWFLSSLLFALLLWQPVSLSTALLRVLRDRIYFDQLLILLAALAWAFFGDNGKQRMLAAFCAGAVLGWFWLTREEGAWILPALGVLALVASVQAYRHQRVRELLLTMGIVIATFTATQVAFRAVNAWAYGKFVGVDFKERNFQRALAALDSVRSGGTKPFVSITHEAMRRVSAVSPTFSSIAPDFDGPGKGWEVFGCQKYPSTCGEISSGWFMWALRDAAQRAGHFSSPAEASAFFGKLADEVEASCKRGALECVPQLIYEMPPVSPRQVAASLWHHSGEALNLLFLLDHSLEPGTSFGTGEGLAAALRFLNYPLHAKPTGSSPLPYMVSGWYYLSGSEWASIAVMNADGSPADARLDRRKSPDIAGHFKDSLALLQRYALSVTCSDACVLEVRDSAGDTVRKTLGELRGAQGFAVGQGTFYIDRVSSLANISYESTRADMAAQQIRVAIFHAYKYLFVPVLLLGSIAFILATIAYWNMALGNVSYLLALVSWLLVLSRVGLLLLIASTSLPALSVHYFAPVYFMLVSGAVFSCAALLQLRRDGPRAATHE
jgi:hypothetical protein